MKYIGRLRKLAAQDSIEFINGQKFIDYIAIIDKEKEDYFTIRFHQILTDGQLGENILRGSWASSLASAKRRIIQDTDWKSKDFAWEIEE